MKSLSRDDYERLSEGGGLIPVYREIPGDLLTPVSAFLAFGARSERAFLLESVLGGERVARYSFLGRDPISSLQVVGDMLLHKSGMAVRNQATTPGALGADLLRALRHEMRANTVEVPGLPRFTGGSVGYLSYDAVRLFERVSDRHPPGPLPIASFSTYRSLVAFDHVQQRLVLITHAAPGRRGAFAEAQGVLDAMEADLRRAPASAQSALRVGPPAPRDLGDGAGFRAAVAQAKEYIAAGDIFQVVLSRQHTVACALDPFSVYRALRMVNPSPYMFFMQEGDTAIAGASPEMLVRVEGGAVEMRPIAGTRRRGSSPEEDEALADELRGDDKERAEHLMLVDLGRNDLGRVCRFRSVSVPEFMNVERYSHVSHLVSAVRGELAADKDALDALVATFPAGTLSGAPKIRAMEIIDELEPRRRGLYGGALGYLDSRGNLDFCIAIRSLVMANGQATLQAGAGIVADSDPDAEQRETEAKAGAMLAALQLAARL